MLNTESPLLLGAEAEFLFVDEGGHIHNLRDVGVLMPADVVGCDGHTDTIEIRSTPARTAEEVFQSVRKNLNLYHKTIMPFVADISHPFPARNAYCIPARAGAYFGTPLGIHVHFSGFPMENAELLVRTCARVLMHNFLERAVAPKELQERVARGYGARAHFTDRIRVKGPNWFEWREPYSCLHPMHFAFLLLGSQVLAEATAANPAYVKAQICEVNHRGPEAYFEKIAVCVPHLKKECAQINQIAPQIRKLGVFNWHQDILQHWTTPKSKRKG